MEGTRSSKTCHVVQQDRKEWPYAIEAEQDITRPQDAPTLILIIVRVRILMIIQSWKILWSTLSTRLFCAKNLHLVGGRARWQRDVCTGRIAADDIGRMLTCDDFLAKSRTTESSMALGGSGIPKSQRSPIPGLHTEVIRLGRFGTLLIKFLSLAAQTTSLEGPKATLAAQVGVVCVHMCTHAYTIWECQEHEWH